MKSCRAIFAHLSCIYLASCQQVPVTKIKGSDFLVEQSGNVKEPASFQKSALDFDWILPEGSRLIFEKPISLNGEVFQEKVYVEIQKPTPLKLRSDYFSSVLSKGFPPPTLNEQIAADFSKKSFYFSGGLILLALLLAYSQHYKAAGFAGIGAIIVPLFARFVSSQAALLAFTISLCISGAIFAAWYFLPDSVKNRIKN